MRNRFFRRRFLLVASLFLVVLVLPILVNSSPIQDAVAASAMQTGGEGLSPDCHQGSEIYIHSNDDFTEKYEFPGDGTEENPYIIEGLRFESYRYGIRIKGTTAHFTIRDCVFESTRKRTAGTAIHIKNVENGIIENCRIEGMSRGIWVQNSEQIRIENCEIIDTRRAIHLQRVINCQVKDSSISSAFYGISIHNSDSLSIVANTVNSAKTGIRIGSSTFVQLENNVVTDTNHFALCFFASFDCTITYNEITDNSGLGIYLYDSNSCILFGNVVGTNEGGNAADEIGDSTATCSNLWDDDVSLGNDWDDYNGVGVYPISGDRESVDRYPIGSQPDILAPEWTAEPSDQIIECGNDFAIDVEASDSNGIAYYSIDNTEYFDVNEFGLITNKVALGIGSYPLEVRAYDPSNNYCSATFIVTVQDTVCPEIVSPADVTYKEGETGKTIEWTIFDINPSSFEIHRDDVLMGEFDWNEASFTIIVSIDGLMADTYLYRIDVFDLGGNSVSDEVTVVVEPEKTSTTTTTGPIPKPNTAIDPPSDDSMAAPVVEPVVIASGIAIPTVIGIVILYILGRKQEGA